MIDNWKLGFHSLKYAYGRMSSSILMAVFFLIGILFYVMAPTFNNTFAGGYMLMCTALMPTQMIYSLSVSNFVQASPVKNKMQTSVPAVFTAGSMTILYLINTLIHGVMIVVSPETAGTACAEMIMQAVVMAAMMLYLGIAYKYFFVSIIMFFFVFFSVYSGGAAAQALFEAVNINIPFVLAAALGFALIAVGAAAQYLASLIVYKAPMSKMAQTAALRKEL